MTKSKGFSNHIHQSGRFWCMFFAVLLSSYIRCFFSAVFNISSVRVNVVGDFGGCVDAIETSYTYGEK